MSLNSMPRFSPRDPGGIATSDADDDPPMPRTDQPGAGTSTNVDDSPKLDLCVLVRTCMEARGWSYRDLERASGGALTRGRWQQLGSGVAQRKFPEPGSLTVIAQVLELDITTVVLAAARSVGLDVSRRGAELADLLPAETELLSERMRDAILTLIRSAVAETDSGAKPTWAASLSGMRLEWPKHAATIMSTSSPDHAK